MLSFTFFTFNSSIQFWVSHKAKFIGNLYYKILTDFAFGFDYFFKIEKIISR